MVLKVGEQDWKLHFHITEPSDQEALWYVTVKCLVHTGPCVLTSLEPKYCVNGSAGVANCSKRDQFVRSVGNRLALTRAIAHMPFSTRQQIWHAYWQKVRRPKETSAAFRKRVDHTSPQDCSS